MCAMDITVQLRQGVDAVRLSLALTQLKDHAALTERLTAQPENPRLHEAVQLAWGSLNELGAEVRLIEQAAFAAELAIADLSLAQVRRFLGLAPSRAVRGAESLPFDVVGVSS